MTSETEIRSDCEKLLIPAFINSPSAPSDLFVMGLTKAYFCSGSLEQLDTQWTKAFDKKASVIQARIRGMPTFHQAKIEI